MADKIIKPVSSLNGKVQLPGDKSISHRALLFNSISNGKCKITGLSTAEDIKSTMRCLKALGVKISFSKKSATVNGVGKYGLVEPKKMLDAGNSGTTMRLITGMLAAQKFVSKITGDNSLKNRPMRRIIEPLELMGAQIDSNNYKAPLTIYGRQLRAIDYASPVASAQVKSCLLLAGLYANGVTRITEPYFSRDHSERMLSIMGGKIHSSEAMSAIKGPCELTPCDIDVPADISAAAFFLVAGSLLKNSKLEMLNVGMNSTRTGILDALTSMGAHIQIDQNIELNNESRARLVVQSSLLKGTTLEGAMIPRIIDEIPIIAVAATQAEGITNIKNAGELRVKESDRLEAIVVNLKRMGAKVRELKDGLVITGPVQLKGAEIDSYGDHRIAMAFSIAALLCEGETIIKNIDCVDISFPHFYQILDSLGNDKSEF